MKKVYASLALCVLGVSASSVAGADGYIAAGYAQLDHSERFFSDGDYDTGNLVVKLGADISRYFGAELRLGTTIVKHDESLGGAEVEYKQDYCYGG